MFKDPQGILLSYAKSIWAYAGRNLGFKDSPLSHTHTEATRAHEQPCSAHHSCSNPPPSSHANHSFHQLPIATKGRQTECREHHRISVHPPTLKRRHKTCREKWNKGEQHLLPYSAVASLSHLCQRQEIRTTSREGKCMEEKSQICTSTQFRRKCYIHAMI